MLKIMFQNYVKTAFRSLLKGKLYSFINLAGLTVGTATVILLALFVRDEWTFDTFHQKSDRIYRAWVKEQVQDQVLFNTVTPVILGDELRANFPEIQQVGRYLTSNFLVKKGNFSEQEEMHIVEPEFFKIFDFQWIRGEPSQSLVSPRQIVLTEEMAEKYFGEPQPIGQTLKLQFEGEWTDFTVSGIVEQPPGNSSIQFGFLVPYENTKTLLSEGGRQSWTVINVETYVLMPEGTDMAVFEQKIAPFIDGKVADDYDPGQYTIGFQLVTDIHLNGDFPTGFAPVSNRSYARILGGVALLILLLAAINYTTIAIGRAVGRAKEVGVRKVTGAGRGQLMMQFWSEAILTAGLAVIAGAIVVEMVLPFFNSLTDKRLIFDFSWQNVLACTTLALLTGLISGAYPAVVQSGFSPIRSLRGSVTKIGNDKHVVLRGLVGFQFMLSILLIACTLVMGQQLRFLQNKNLGFEREQVVVLPYSDSGLRLTELIAEGKKTTDRLRNELAGKPGFVDFTWSNHTFGTAGWAQLGYTDERTDQYRRFFLNGMDSRFLSLMGIQLAEGRLPNPEQNAADERTVVVNKAYVAAFGVQMGQPLQAPFQDYTVVGVTEDFNFESLHSQIEPLVLAAEPIGLVRNSPDISFLDFPNPKISVKISGENIPATLTVLQQAWQKVAPDQAFDYAFLDDNLDRQYRSEQRFSKVVSYATGLAIFIACLGLFGIATLSIAKRTKEIGVRKVLGATTADIIFQLNKNFTLLVLLSALLALPLAWYFMAGWLDDFAYRISVSPLTLGLAAVTALALTWGIVGWQSFRAAGADPVKSLRSE